MSKTLGNVIDPMELVNKYGSDALRYYFLREIPAYMDGDFSEKRFIELYNADLANGLGNLISRVAKLAENLDFPPTTSSFVNFLTQEYQDYMAEYRFSDALKTIQDFVSAQDAYLNQTTPWKLEGSDKQRALSPVVAEIRKIAVLLKPFLPNASDVIADQYSATQIKVQKPLFPRIVLK